MTEGGVASVGQEAAFCPCLFPSFSWVQHAAASNPLETSLQSRPPKSCSSHDLQHSTLSVAYPHPSQHQSFGTPALALEHLIKQLLELPHFLKHTTCMLMPPGVSAATSKVCAERKGRDVYVVGAANVGKSAFVRAMLKVCRSGVVCGHRT